MPGEPYSVMRAIRRLFRGHKSQLDTLSQVPFIVDKRDMSTPYNFLTSCRRVLPRAAQARWAMPWARGQQKNVLIIEPGGRGQDDGRE